MIALDANILIYAYRKEFPDHSRAHRLLSRLANGAEPWALPWLSTLDRDLSRFPGIRTRNPLVTD